MNFTTFFKVYPHVAPNSTGAHGYSKAEDNFKLTIDLMDNDERAVEPCSFVVRLIYNYKNFFFIFR